MAELVDARDSKSRDCEVMGVRFPLPAPVEGNYSSVIQVVTWYIVFVRWYFCGTIHETIAWEHT